ncbi:MAG: extracellular solute-binding protein [Chloroflexota bacterium]|nr:extracellular solute-binding protein [Chloroflexota bacterium]MDE2840379.1 extracellular solute-binding protein [Chloroflexota bacterium]
MLSRRTMLASASALAAIGCGHLKSLYSDPNVIKETELTWASRQFVGLGNPNQVMATLAADEEIPDSPQQARYRLTVRNLEQAPRRDDLDAWRNLGADLLTVSVEEARSLGEMGVLHPLDRFGDANDSALNAVFFPGVLNQFRAQGALYALPVSALPVMLYYDRAYFAQRGVPPVDSGWDWDNLAENAAKLTNRGQDGEVRRWGLLAHSKLWWALWQNNADVVDPAALQCRLQESAAIEALQFVWDLLHTMQVSPRAHGMDLNKVTPPPAMVYDNPPLRPSLGSYGLAQIPQGKTQAVPVRAGVGLAVAAGTQSPETAYTALKGLAHAIQRHASVPATREGIERLGEFQPGLRSDEVQAIQRSMAAEREMPRLPQGKPELYAMEAIVEGLVRGDNVSTVVNQACSVLREHQQSSG